MRLSGLVLVLSFPLVACTGAPDAAPSLATGGAAASVAPAAHDSGPVGRSIDAAAGEAGVPADLLLAIAVEEGGLHLAALRQVEADDPVPVAGRLELRHGRLDTLAMGARLMGTTEDALRADTDLGTRAGAAVLAELGRQHGAGADLASWRPALEALSGMGDYDARNYAGRVFAILRTGGAFPARAGELVQVAAHPTIDEAETVQVQRLAAGTPDFPGATWFDTSCTNKCNVGRPLGNASVNKIVIHDTEGGWDGSVATLQYDGGKSVHYIIDADGSRVGQFRPETDTTWHAGNYYYNETSVGIEHVGVASDASGYSDGLYARSRELVQSIRSRWDVPLDRTHIVGHYQIPNGNKIAESSAPCTDTLDACENSANYGGAANHRDPGYYWQWCQYMEGLGGSCTCNDAWSLWNCTTDGAEAVRCNNGQVEIEQCTGGCDVMAIGTDDVCHVAPDGGGDGSGSGSGSGSGGGGGPGGGPGGGDGTDPGGSGAGGPGDVVAGCAAAGGGQAGGALLLIGASLIAIRRRRR
jgi:N-acetyl-anhydromuramyl-L-alanine amidase AmpD